MQTIYLFELLTLTLSGDKKAHTKLNMHLQQSECSDEQISLIIRETEKIISKNEIDNNTPAFTLRGFLHYLGKGGPVDEPKARALYQQAIARNDPQAMNNLALMYSHSDHLNIKIDLYKKAISLGCSNAMSNLADTYLSHFTLDKSKRMQAINLLKQAVAQDDPRSMFLLARIAENENNILDAIKYYQFGVKLGCAQSMLCLSQLFSFNRNCQLRDRVKGAKLIRQAYLTVGERDGFSFIKNKIYIALVNLSFSEDMNVQYHAYLGLHKTFPLKLFYQNPQQMLTWLATDELLMKSEKYIYFLKIEKEFTRIENEFLIEIKNIQKNLDIERLIHNIANHQRNVSLLMDCMFVSLTEMSPPILDKSAYKDSVDTVNDFYHQHHVNIKNILKGLDERRENINVAAKKNLLPFIWKQHFSFFSKGDPKHASQIDYLICRKKNM